MQNVGLNEIGVFSGAAGEVAHVVQIDAGDVQSPRGENFDVVTAKQNERET